MHSIQDNGLAQGIRPAQQTCMSACVYFSLPPPCATVELLHARVAHTDFPSLFFQSKPTASCATMGIKVGDLVLAYHGALIYDAKVLKVDSGHGVQEASGVGVCISASTQLYVHYQGWAKKWDEWVRHDRVLEATPANRLLQQTAKAELAQAKQQKRVDRKRTASSRSRTGAATDRQSPFKRLRRNVEQEFEELPRPDEAGGAPGGSKHVTIQMPFSLKKQLVEDWKRVTQAPYQLVPLPRKPNVRQVRRH